MDIYVAGFITHRTFAARGSEECARLRNLFVPGGMVWYGMLLPISVRRSERSSLSSVHNYPFLPARFACAAVYINPIPPAPLHPDSPPSIPPTTNIYLLLPRRRTHYTPLSPHSFIISSPPPPPPPSRPIIHPSHTTPHHARENALQIPHHHARPHFHHRPRLLRSRLVQPRHEHNLRYQKQVHRETVCAGEEGGR